MVYYLLLVHELINPLQACVATAITSQRALVELYMHPTYVILLATVVVGNVKPMATYVAFHVNARAVPLSSKRKISLLPSTGLPVGALIVKALAKAVKLYWSTVAMSGVIDAAELVVLTLGFTRAFDTVPLVTFVAVVAVVAVAALPVVLWLSVGTSAATMARNVGVPATPLGAASTVFAV
jgi:hypothetical protein